MIKLFRRLTAKEWGMMVLATIFIGIAVWMDLKTPEYLSDITRLLAKQGTKVADILEARRKNVALVTRWFFDGRTGWFFSFSDSGKFYDSPSERSFLPGYGLFRCRD